MKQCRKCGNYKADEEFPWRNRLLGRRATICKTCTSEQSRDWYQDNRERQIETVKKRKAGSREEAQRFIYEYLSGSVCADCGSYNFEVLTFDHVKGEKKMDITQMAQQGYSVEAIKREIMKTEVVCFNCHMMRESRRRTGKGRFGRFWPY